MRKWRNNYSTLIKLAFSLHPLYSKQLHCENKEQEMPFNECFNLAAGLVSITGSYQRQMPPSTGLQRITAAHL